MALVAATPASARLTDSFITAGNAQARWVPAVPPGATDGESIELVATARSPLDFNDAAWVTFKGFARAAPASPPSFLFKTSHGGRRRGTRGRRADRQCEHTARSRRGPAQDALPGGLKTLPVVAAEVATGGEVDQGSFDGNSAWIDFVGESGTMRSVSFSQVVKGETRPGLFRDKVVVIGAAAPSLHDVHATSTTRDEVMAGPEIQANALDTARRGFPLRSVPGALNVAMIVLLGMVAPLASIRLSALRTTMLALAQRVTWAQSAGSSTR